MPAYPAVQPHGALTPISEDVWLVTGSVLFKPLIRLPRNMIVVRHAGELTLINAVRLDAEGQAALEALGDVAHVMKIGLHGMDDAYYCDAYRAKHWRPHRGTDAPADDAVGVLDEAAALPIPNARVFSFEHTVVPETAILLEQDGGLLITCDSVQHWAPHPLMSLAASLLTHVMGFRYPAQIGRPWRKRQTPAGGTLRGDFERLAELPFDRLIGGHGGLLDGGAPEALRATIARELA